MKTLRFRGSPDGFCVGSRYPIVSDSFELVSPSEQAGLRIVGMKLSNVPPLWRIGFEPFGPNQQPPTWQLRFVASDDGYSLECLIDVPEDTEVTV